MIYDTQPWIDYFRKLDDDTLVAMIDMKGTPMGTGFFMLVAGPAPRPAWALQSIRHQTQHQGCVRGGLRLSPLCRRYTTEGIVPPSFVALSLVSPSCQLPCAKASG
jgi:Domain of unknown function (DUF4334)